MHSIEFHDDVQFLHDVTRRCAKLQKGADGMWQLAPVFASIQHHSHTYERLRAFDSFIAEMLPELSRYGRARAKKAYGSHADTITKPSYSRRLRIARGTASIAQLDQIENIYVREPHSGGLVFNVFDPIDLENRTRPGYVPCLVAGSFLMSDGRLAINAFFRSQSIVEFGLHDLIFLRELQDEFAERFTLRKGGRPVARGALNLSFGRIIIQRRLARRRKRMPTGRYRHIHLDREVTLRKWLRIATEFARG